ncbi:murein biosynthesis integral membrane protein MurJ [Bacillus sp. FJAT-29790]|uniref:murein biosynthesis integral membrane protein MurJ n=1 Tax=Bacillus sp. FJAT-29790 TaxID=1895002 RepID=UPI001C229BE5|nr:murein biosynthesis integral membrane protein MurJ [Bacillus sp. FJAT-29790]MBU8881158.1 murein biosynthesis integral membrane protein MurJ [Bacillus sp. FJAT-29790]
MNKASLIKIIGAVAVINLISRFFGFFREVVIGYHFGTSYVAESIITAYTIPNFIYIVAGGAITTAFISVYNKAGSTQIQTELKEIIFTYSLLIFSALSLVFFMFSEWWVATVFTGLSGEELKVTTGLFRVMGPTTLLLVLSMYFSGLLNVTGKFQITAIAPLINNFLFILIAIILFPFLNEEAYAWGAVAGALVLVIMLTVSLRKIGERPFRLRFAIAEKEYGFRFIKIALPILLGGATLQFYFLIQRIFASSLEEGYLAALNYSSKLVQLPQSILMGAVTTVIYPLIAKKVAEGNKKDLAKMYSEGIQYMLFLMIPSTIFILFYAKDMVKVIFEYGSFDEKSSIMTSGLLKIFVFGMFAHAANLYVTRFFYAMERALLPVISGLLAVFGVNVLIVLLFIGDYGADAIAWGTTISAYFQLLLLLFAGRNMLKLKMLHINNIWRQLSLLPILLFIALICTKWLDFESPILNLIIGFAALSSGFIVVGKWLKVREIERLNVSSVVRRRLGR